MATIDIEAEPDTRNRTALGLLLGLAGVAGLVFLYAYLTRPPQMGASEEVFHTVDALYTAVRNQDEKRLGQCEQRLNGYRDEGKLPPAAARSLGAIIGQARSGSWQPAAQELYRFMLAQRRDGAESEPHHHPSRAPIQNGSRNSGSSSRSPNARR